MDLAGKIETIFLDCLYKPEEIDNGKTPQDAILVQGIVRDFGFHPQRLQSHKEEVRLLLTEMPKEFHRQGGGGWTFLNLCMDKNGNQWGEHLNMEQLVVLAIGCGLGKYQLPKDLWVSLPGGMPYVVFDVEQP